MPEIKQSRSAEETIARRMRNSGGEGADKTILTGEGGVRRTYHNVHLSGGQAQHGGPNKGELGIDGRMRGPADQGATGFKEPRYRSSCHVGTHDSDFGQH